MALVHNWRFLFVRLAHPQAWLEATTNRPLRLPGTAEKTRHARHERLTSTPVHGQGGLAKVLLPHQVSALLKGWKNNAEQLTSKTVWESVCDPLIALLTGFDGLLPRVKPPGQAAQAMPAWQLPDLG